jgi:uncharacterized protein YndB with AHSA1/START domain
MEWTGARYADCPTVEVSTWIDAPVSQVWRLVEDISLMPRLSEELQAVEWLDGFTGPTVGARFTGRSKHPSLGEWSTTSCVVEYESERAFAWAVEDAERPTATWRFTARPVAGGGTALTQWVRLGPGRSGLNHAIDAMPDKEEQIVFVRLREFERAMLKNLAAIKALVEQA